MSIDTASPDEAQLVALGRSVAYACLAAGFTWPNGDAPAPPSGDDAGPLGRLIGALADARTVTSLDDLQSSFMRIFDPRQPPHPFEAEHLTEHFRQRTDMLADLNGFYEAFAVSPNHERPDHIGCELEFIHLLSLKEALAIRDGRAEQAEVCAEARQKFLSEHLLLWYERVVEVIRLRAVDPEDRFYLALADLLEALMAQEKETQT
jgi:TorA maturation chaperone TorD